MTAKELARLEKQRKLAQTLRLKAEADEAGVDMERKKNWEWSIEENERWQKKLDEQKERSDSLFHSTFASHLPPFSPVVEWVGRMTDLGRRWGRRVQKVQPESEDDQARFTPVRTVQRGCTRIGSRHPRARRRY